MSNETKNSNQSGWKRTLLEWGGMAAVIGILYVTGLHTEVLGTMQRAMLWTGLFDADTEQMAGTSAPKDGSAVYRMQLTTPEGETVRLSDFEGDVLFINIWASWCPPCVAEMPTIETLYHSVSDVDNIRFLLISTDRRPKDATGFMDRRDFPMPYYFPASSLPSVLQSSYIPSTYVVSKEGEIIYSHEGIADYGSDDFRQWLLGQAEG